MNNLLILSQLKKIENLTYEEKDIYLIIKNLYNNIKNIFYNSICEIRIFYKNLTILEKINLIFFSICSFLSIISYFCCNNLKNNLQQFNLLEKFLWILDCFYNSITNAVFFSIFAILVTVLLSSITFTINTNGYFKKINNMFFIISSFFNCDFRIKGILLLLLLKEKPFDVCIWVFFLIEVISKYNIIVKEINKYSEFSYIKFNIMNGVSRQHIFFFNILPHMNVFLFETFFSTLGGYLFFVDSLPGMNYTDKRILSRKYPSLIYQMSLYTNLFFGKESKNYIFDFTETEKEVLFFLSILFFLSLSTVVENIRTYLKRRKGIDCQ